MSWPTTGRYIPKKKGMKKVGFLVLLGIMISMLAAAQKRIIYISHELGYCKDSATAKCIQYRYKQNDDWMPLVGSIKGFTYEPGNAYRLLVKETRLRTGTRRSLLKVLEKEGMMSIALPQENIGGQWVISGIFKDGQKEDIASKNFVMGFNEGAHKITGKVCNGFGGNLATEKGNRITIANIISTKMYCPDMEYETLVLEALQKSTNYSLENGMLVLQQDGKSLLELVPQKKVSETQTVNGSTKSGETRGIDNQTWKFTSLKFEGASIDVSSLASMITFDERDGRVNGKAPCNTFFGELLLEKLGEGKGKIKLDKLASTMMACPELSTEQKIMKALALVNNYEVKGNTLWLKQDASTVFELTNGME